MKAIFLSDAHLKYENSTGYRNLLNFFDSIKGSVSDLFIVGDFFDFWFCRNGCVYPEFQAMTGKLLELKEKGINIHLFEGNHDFFLDEFFGPYGIHVFPDWAAINLDDKRIFVSHGDTVDTKNISYLLLRRFMRSKIFYGTQKKLPVSILWKIARISSKISKNHLQGSPEGLADKMRIFSMEKFSDGFDAVILGHCHQPVIERHVVDGRERTFAILGDWINHYSYLLYENGDSVLVSYKP
ncbi:MAG: UDP-2,3-diacylglucosamine diphosphatase [Syntrophobacterales bacterium]|nr:UDP-2,3-diacylglucosamine diphosphatase [Syntrophobacterales bacterium]